MQCLRIIPLQSIFTLRHVVWVLGNYTVPVYYAGLQQELLRHL